MEFVSIAEENLAVEVFHTNWPENSGKCLLPIAEKKISAKKKFLLKNSRQLTSILADVFDFFYLNCCLYKPIRLIPYITNACCHTIKACIVNRILVTLFHLQIIISFRGTAKTLFQNALCVFILNQCLGCFIICIKLWSDKLRN